MHRRTVLRLAACAGMGFIPLLRPRAAAAQQMALPPLRPVHLVVTRPKWIDQSIRLADDGVSLYNQQSGLPSLGIGLNSDYSALEATPGAWMLFSAHKTQTAKTNAPFQSLDYTQPGWEVRLRLANGSEIRYAVTDSFVHPTLETWGKIWANRKPDTISLYGCEGPGIYQNPATGEKIEVPEDQPGPTGWLLIDRRDKRGVLATLVV